MGAKRLRCYKPYAVLDEVLLFLSNKVRIGRLCVIVITQFLRKFPYERRLPLMNLPNLKRRTAAIFYPLQVPIRYKMENQIAGQGRTIELNGELVRFESDRPLPANR